MYSIEIVLFYYFYWQHICFDILDIKSQCGCFSLYRTKSGLFLVYNVCFKNMCIATAVCPRFFFETDVTFEVLQHFRRSALARRLNYRPSQFTSPYNFTKRSVNLEKNIVSSILPKNERWDNFQYIKLSQRSFFGRIQDAIICFRDLLTFSKYFNAKFKKILAPLWPFCS